MKRGCKVGGVSAAGGHASAWCEAIRRDTGGGNLSTVPEAVMGSGRMVSAFLSNGAHLFMWVLHIHIIVDVQDGNRC